MIRKLTRHPAISALCFAIFPAVQLLWEHTHGGVVSHYLLNRKDLPAISNWWGLLTIPLLAYITFRVIRERPEKQAFQGFLGGLAFGALLAAFWAFGLVEYMPPMLLVPLILAFFLPTYRMECLLGFVLGMAWTFGGVLPIAIGGILGLGSWIIYKGIRGGILKLMGR